MEKHHENDDLMIIINVLRPYYTYSASRNEGSDNIDVVHGLGFFLIEVSVSEPVGPV